jgi:hypothetical protein
MRLTEEDIKILKQFDFNINGHSGYETIIALKQEYQELDAGHSKLFKDFCETREVLKQAREALFVGQFWAKKDEHTASLEQIEEAIAAIDKVVGE